MELLFIFSLTFFIYHLKLKKGKKNKHFSKKEKVTAAGEAAVG